MKTRVFSAVVLLASGRLAFAQVPLAPVPGASEFVQQCGFCHGRDAGGGEEGPDLTRSKLVTDDKGGDKIGPVIRNGRPGTGMPGFTVSDQQLASLVGFIHEQKRIAEAQNGQRKGVDVSDLQTGNAAAGKQYFNGTGKCSTCHSPTGDLAGFADRYEGLKLMQRFLFPRGAKVSMTVTLASGDAITGEMLYRDEFNVALRDSAGKYRAFPAAKVKINIDDPSQAHVDLLPKYSDDDIHDLMAYLQTLKQSGGTK